MRKYLYLLVIIGLSSLGLAQNVRQDNIAFSRSGFPAPGALVAVCLQPATAGSTSLTACAPLAPLCSSSTDAICSSPNPVTADGLGNYHFYVKPGTYAIQIYGSGLTLSLLRDQTVGGSSGGSAGAATTEVLANCTATGTILNEGVELSSQVISGVLTACGTVASASSTSVIGICSSGCGITGSAQIAYQAFQSAIFDNQTVIGDVAAPSSSPGQFTDIGSVRVPGVESVGRIASINSGVGTTATINMFTGDMTASGASNGSGNVSQCNTSGGVSFYSAIGTIVVCDPSATLDGNGKLTAKQVVVNGTGPGTVTLQTGTAPANPSAGNGLLYVDSGTGFLSCLNSSGGSCNPITTSLSFSALTNGTNTTAAMHVGTGASLDASGSGTIAATSVPFSGVLAGSNLAALTMGNAGSLKPVNLGQIAGDQTWLQPGLAAPAAVSSNTGGSLNSAHATAILYTLNSALGETMPSAEVAANNIAGFGAGCTSGTSCSITVTAPTIPSGYTGYTIYSRDCNTLTTCGGPELKQTASAACVNITINCVIQVGGAGASYPTTNTAVITPPSVQAGFVPLGASPSLFFPKANGQYFPLAGMDFSSGNPLVSPDGTFEFWHRLFISDSGQNLSNATQAGGGLIRDALVSIGHVSGNATATGAGIDDRVLAFRGVDSPTSATYEQWLGIYGEHLIYNNNFVCGPVGTTFIGEDCAAAIRVRTNDQRTAGVNSITLVGIHGTASTNVAAPKVGGALPAVVGVVGTADQESVSSQNAAGSFYAGVLGSFSGSAGNTNGSGYSLWAKAPTTRFATQNGALFIENGFSNASDFGIRSDATSNSRFQGSLQFPAFSADKGLVTGTANISVLGITTAQSSTPSISVIGNIGVAGAVNYQYKIVVRDVAGGTTAASIVSQTNTGNATLNGSNFNRVTFTAGSITGTEFIDVYRTVSAGSPGTTGKIGTFTVTDNTNGTFIAQQFDDTGLAGDGSTPPTVNSSGGIAAAGDFVFNNGKGQHFNTQAANNDFVGTCTLASATPSTCTVTFTRAYTVAPVCVATNQTTQANPIKSAPTTANVVFTGPNTVTDVVAYMCAGNPN